MKCLNFYNKKMHDFFQNTSIRGLFFVANILMQCALIKLFSHSRLSYRKTCAITESSDTNLINATRCPFIRVIHKSLL